MGRPKRMILEIPDDLHMEVKKRALFKNITLRVWVIRALLAAIKEEEKSE